MYDARAAALANNGFAFFALPPDQPAGRRREKDTNAVRRVLRAIRREMARAGEQATVLPRITNYPY